jgi:hypothetical protein
VTNAIIIMKLISLTNGVGVARRRHRLCHSFVYDNQSTWKNFDRFASEHKPIRSEHELIRSEHELIRSEHELIHSEHELIRSLGQWRGVEVWQRQPGI